jgi:hypothetical protein
LYLCDEVRIKVHAIENDRQLVANTNNVAKAFRGWVGRHPGPTMMSPLRPCCLITLILALAAFALCCCKISGCLSTGNGLVLKIN